MTLAIARGRRKVPDGSAVGAGADAVPADPQALLAWYDASRRRLPWRVEPGEAVDPYRVWLSEIMLQQTTVRSVAPYYEKFLALWPDVGALAAAPLDDVLRAWAGLGYYARARNLHACAGVIVDRHGGCFPEAEDALRQLPGIGAYTAAAIAAIAFGHHATPVDGNVERVVARLFAVEDLLPAAKPRLRALAATLTPSSRSGDYAQAMMDLGAAVCLPRRPLCATCPFRPACRAAGLGIAEELPRRQPKRGGDLRRGAAFWLMRGDGCVLVRRRPSEGLLGGMTEIPSSSFGADQGAAAMLAQAPLLPGVALDWRRLPGTVRHVFTHFPLELVVYAADAEAALPAPEDARWVPVADLGAEALPTLMRKVVAHARGIAGD